MTRWAWQCQRPSEREASAAGPETERDTRTGGARRTAEMQEGLLTVGGQASWKPPEGASPANTLTLALPRSLQTLTSFQMGRGGVGVVLLDSGWG